MCKECRILGGKYQILREIGKGGTSVVYLAEALSDGKRYAVKELAQSAGAGEKRAMPSGAGQGRAASPGGALLMELKMQQKLHHPALPHIWEVWEEQGRIYIVMDYVEGVSLQELLKKEGARPPQQAVEWALQLCRALGYLHGFQPPVIYRDMKPANVILRTDGRVMLVDFGTARQYRPHRRRDTVPLGTPGYAAPEQYRGRQSDIRTDIYALGVTLYQMLTGHDPGEPPYRICKIREWNRELSPRLERIVLKCTAEKPYLRYQSCAGLQKALEEYQKASGRAGKGIFGKSCKVLF